jgi:predicted nucleotidyltransferase
VNPRDPNVALVELVAKALGNLNERLVFVGGCATGLLVTDRGRPPVRATRDVDLIAEIASHAEYYELSGELRAVGFREEQGDVICRWRLDQVIVDVMPTDERILGFSNRWYVRAIEKAFLCRLPSSTEIRLISAPLLIATKIEAFYGRGHGDFASHDVEDIINVVDGRPELAAEIRESDQDLREYLSKEIDSLLGNTQFLERIPWHISPDTSGEGRDTIVIERLRAIAGA